MSTTCGPFATAASRKCTKSKRVPDEEISEAFKVLRETFSETRINYDVRPTTRVASVRLDAQGAREIVGLPWMWIHPKYRHCNAKGENVARYPAYRESFVCRRCLVPARGFYEWKPIEGTKLKQRYYIERADGQPLAFAGLFNEDASMMATITTTPNEEISRIHDRTPVSIAPTAWGRYLAPEPLTEEERQRMLATPPPGTFRYWPVANNATGPDLIKEVAPLTVPPADAPLPTRPKKKLEQQGQDLFG